MKKFILPTIIVLLLISCAPDEFHQGVIAFQDELNEQYADSMHSPLLEQDRLTFTGHEYFPINKKYRVEAKFIRTPDQKPFEMKTSTDRLPVYVKYGEAHFELDGKEVVLNIYQNVNLVKKEEYKDYLFLPCRF